MPGGLIKILKRPRAAVSQHALSSIETTRGARDVPRCAWVCAWVCVHRLPGLRATMYDALLAKLDPASMMEVGGLGKARIAINLLCKASESEPAAAAGGIAAVADGVKVLMQTALLHPEPSLREGAVSVLACCCACNDESFIASRWRRPASLGGAGAAAPSRIQGKWAEGTNHRCRRAAARRVPHLLLGTDGAVATRAARWSGIAGTPWALRNSDATIRERAAALLISSAPAGPTPHAGSAGRGPRPRLRRRRSGQGGGERRRARRRRPGRRAADLEALAALRAARADDRKLREALENAGAETALGDAAADLVDPRT